MKLLEYSCKEIYKLCLFNFNSQEDEKEDTEEEAERPMRPKSKKTSWKYLPLNEKTGISLALLFFGYPQVRKDDDDEDIVVCLLCKKSCQVSNYEGMIDVNILYVWIMGTKPRGPLKYLNLIAFNTVIFCLQHVLSLPCAFVALFNHYAIARAYKAENAHAQGSDWGMLKPESYSLVEGNRLWVCAHM